MISTFSRLWPRAKTVAVVLFVVWQLFFLIVRNPLDFWYTRIKGWCEEKKIWDGVKEVIDPVDDATRHYGNFAGIDQNWGMFVPPMARSASFLAARVEFTDDTEELLRSDNEPDPLGYFRFGGWRQRKLEDYLVYKTPEELPGNDELPLWQAYARWRVRRWRERRPDDLSIRRVGAAVARRASHRSGRAQLTHPARPVTASLSDGTPSGPLAAAGVRNTPTTA